MGIKDKDFREGNSKTLKTAFGLKLDKIIKPQSLQNPQKYQLNPIFVWPKPNKYEKKGIKRIKSSELQQLHEAYQYLLKRKALQVTKAVNSVLV